MKSIYTLIVIGALAAIALKADKLDDTFEECLDMVEQDFVAMQVPENIRKLAELMQEDAPPTQSSPILASDAVGGNSIEIECFNFVKQAIDALSNSKCKIYLFKHISNGSALNRPVIDDKFRYVHACLTLNQEDAY